MEDNRKKDLEKIIKCVFTNKQTMIDKRKNQVIIGGSKRADKCSFLETDKEYYINLFRYTFLIEGTLFVDKDHNNYNGFDRKTAVDNAITYLESIGITIKCTLYCESEKKLLARFIYQILEEILLVMFSFGKDFNEKEYNKKLEKVKKRYHRKIVSNGIISSIYSNAKWSDVELYKENDNCNECLLIDIGSDWKRMFSIPHVKTGVNIFINSDTNTVSNSNLGISHECSKLYILNNKPIIEGRAEVCYLDFFHLDNEYYVPSRFCYCTNVNLTQMDIYTKEDNQKELQEVFDIGKEYTDHSLQRETKEIKPAVDYLLKKYCSDKKKQYVNTLSVISKIISSLSKINYSKFYSKEYKFANTVFNLGFEQLTYFIEDNNINYSKEEIDVIYKYLITEWIKSFPHYLNSFDFEEMFKYYNKTEDDEYANNIDQLRRTIYSFKTFGIFDSAYGLYMDFYNKNEELIDEYKRSFRINIIDPASPLDDLFDSINGDSFTQLKEAIKEFQGKLNWRVPYYLRKTIVEGQFKHMSVDRLLGYGQVGDTKNIEHSKSEIFTVEGPDSITLGFNRNIAEIKYILKPEYILEQSGENTNQNNAERTNVGLLLKKNQKYHIEFEALGNSTAPFSVIIIRRTKNNNFDSVFEKNDIELSSDFKSYSYEFTYNEENEGRCYLAFGYDNIIGGYNIRNLHVSEIE